MRRVKIVLIVLMIAISATLAVLSYFQNLDESNRLECEIREEFGYRDGMKDCGILFR